MKSRRWKTKVLVFGLVFGRYTYLGERSLPCCIKDPIVNHIELIRLNSFTKTSGSSVHGCGLSHSYGLNLLFTKLLIINAEMENRYNKTNS